jgi:hypothetical protein
MRIHLRNGATRHSSGEFEALLTQLRCAGIPVAGGGYLVGEDEQIILIERDSDTDRAIAILAKLGIEARRG